MCACACACACGGINNKRNHHTHSHDPNRHSRALSTAKEVDTMPTSKNSAHIKLQRQKNSSHTHMIQLAILELCLRPRKSTPCRQARTELTVKLQRQKNSSHTHMIQIAILELCLRPRKSTPFRKTGTVPTGRWRGWPGPRPPDGIHLQDLGSVAMFEQKNLQTYAHTHTHTYTHT